MISISASSIEIDLHLLRFSEYEYTLLVVENCRIYTRFVLDYLGLTGGCSGFTYSA
jgi:hypothetical protein